MTHIGVDFHVLSGIFQGSRRYLKNIYREVTKLDTENRYIFYYNRPEDWPPPEERLGEVGAFGTSTRSGRLIFASPRLAKRDKLDWFHFQYFSPLTAKVRIALTVHDILFKTHPQYFTRKFVFWSNILVKQSCRKASHIFTPSHYTKEMLQEHWGIDPAKMSVTPNSVDSAVFNPEGREASRALVKEQHDLDDYILTVGRLEPRKNHATLFRAYRLLKDRMVDVPRLVVVGQRDFSYRGIFALVSELGLEKDIVFIENADDTLLPHLYRACLIFAYPSYAEGFGIPPLEAMASGRPVISSNTTAIPEIAGDTSLLGPPDDADYFARQMEMLIGDTSQAEALARAGYERSKRFTWAEGAKVLVDFYRGNSGGV